MPDPRETLVTLGRCLLPAAALLCAAQPAMSDDDERRSTRTATTAAATPLSITQARWRSDRRRIDAEGSGTNGQRVTLANAYALSSTYGSDTIESGSWRIRRSDTSPAPCRVRATLANGQFVEANVAGAPANCAPKAPTSPPPSVSINDVTVSEGAGTALFTVSLTAPATQPVSVQYATRNGTASAGETGDYRETNGTLTIAADYTVPAPAGLAVLGLGGLVASRRRR